MSADDKPTLGIAAPKAPQVSGAPTKPKHTPPDPQAPASPTLEAGGNSQSAAPAPVEPVSDAMVRALLAGIGGGIGGAGRLIDGLTGRTMIVDPDLPKQWRFTDDELDALTPPITRIVNRTPALAEAVRRGDALVLGIELTSYMSRNMSDGRMAKKARMEEHNDNARDPRAALHVSGQGQAPGAPVRGDDRGGQSRSASPGGSGSGDGWPDAVGSTQ